MDAETNLTPRDRKGVPLNDIPKARVLPSNSNPRSGWRGFLNGQRDDNVYNELNLNSNIKKSILRDHKGFLKRELNQFIDPLQGIIISIYYVLYFQAYVKSLFDHSGI